MEIAATTLEQKRIVEQLESAFKRWHKDFPNVTDIEDAYQSGYLQGQSDALAFSLKSLHGNK